ncbi:uroporphyrinogen-III C-methyltransferase [Marinoscillum pacificum]|uniref:uroporphyrinogen-III C-methyltransferase n=1 Tax=Marinoscillum pacificum TaxID=392723 RepID=UPI0021571C15|nr:uroporphyrinogen-III C-methyltransferase [Marinoscillum pacificum]
MSTLYLIGAGPGDPELITLKAINVLKKAQVVLYDALVNPELLKYCSKECELVYVGKKPGIHQYQQIYINDMIVDNGKQYEHVVRLKGGDPFVFGRGHEELEHARAHGMDVEIVPGISSAISVPAMSEIPVTKRGINESFWVITGTTSSLEMSSDIALAAKSSATVVILMGMRHLSKIVDLFTNARGQSEAIAVIQNGSRDDERSAFCELHNVENQVEQLGLGSPAIIVIGEVARFGKQRELKEMITSVNQDSL